MATSTKKRTTTRKKPAQQQDAIGLLKKDHEKVRGLLSQLERAAERNRYIDAFYASLPAEVAS